MQEEKSRCIAGVLCIIRESEVGSCQIPECPLADSAKMCENLDGNGGLCKWAWGDT